jgi:chaperonin GroES
VPNIVIPKNFASRSKDRRAFDDLIDRLNAPPEAAFDPILEHNYITMWLRPVRPVDAAERWRPTREHTAFVLPFLFEGLTARGVYIEHDYRLPRVFALILKTHPTCDVLKPMQIVMFRPHAFDEYVDSHGETLYALHEASVRALIEFPDKDSMKLIPQNNYIAVIVKEPDEKSTGGVYMPETKTSLGPQEGTIFATSPEVDAAGKYFIDQRVLFSAYSGSETKVNGSDYMLVKATEIIGILEPEPTDVAAALTA